MNPDPVLMEFSFLGKWGGLEEGEKLRLYSQYASHELHYFLSEHDKPFFARYSTSKGQRR